MGDLPSTPFVQPLSRGWARHPTATVVIVAATFLKPP